METLYGLAVIFSLALPIVALIKLYIPTFASFSGFLTPANYPASSRCNRSHTFWTSSKLRHSLSACRFLSLLPVTHTPKIMPPLYFAVSFGIKTITSTPKKRCMLLRPAQVPLLLTATTLFSPTLKLLIPLDTTSR